MIWEPKLDGYDHINIYSKSSSKLGRALSNFTKSTFEHPDYGVFNSIEGFYFWLTGEKHNQLKYLFGYEAKKFGQMQEKTWMVTKEFKEEIMYGIYLKILQHPYVQEMLIESTLPFAHYYYYGDMNGKPKVYDRAKQDHYMIDACELIRVKLKEHGKIIM